MDGLLDFELLPHGRECGDERFAILIFLGQRDIRDAKYINIKYIAAETHQI